MQHANFWFHDWVQPYTLDVSLPKETDVVIVGGGIVGLTTLYQILAHTKLRVILLEEQQPGFRASGRNIGNLDILTPSLISDIHKTEVQDYLRLILRNNNSFFRMIEKDNIECDFNKSGGVYLSCNTNEFDSLTNVMNILQKEMPHETWPRLLSKNDVTQILSTSYFNGGLFMPSEATIHPFKLISELAKLCLKTEQCIFSGAGVDHILQTSRGMNIHVRGKGTISAKYIVYCTNNLYGKMIPGFSQKITLHKQHIIATEEMNPALVSFLYRGCINYNGVKMRLYNNRFLIQSSPTPVTEKYYDTDINNRSCDNLKKLLRTIYPSLSNINIEYAWSLINGVSPDGLPIVGPLSNRPGEFVHSCFGSGNLNNLMITSAMIKDMILGQNTPSTLNNLFNPERI